MFFQCSACKSMYVLVYLTLYALMAMWVFIFSVEEMGGGMEFLKDWLE